MWIIVFSLALLPLAGSLWLNQRRARTVGRLRGMLLLSAAFALLQIPLTIAANAADG
jgi:hypothetical protein